METIELGVERTIPAAARERPARLRRGGKVPAMLYGAKRAGDAWSPSTPRSSKPRSGARGLTSDPVDARPRRSRRPAGAGEGSSSAIRSARAAAHRPLRGRRDAEAARCACRCTSSARAAGVELGGILQPDPPRGRGAVPADRDPRLHRGRREHARHPRRRPRESSWKAPPGVEMPFEYRRRAGDRAAAGGRGGEGLQKLPQSRQVPPPARRRPRRPNRKPSEGRRA